MQFGPPGAGVLPAGGVPPGGDFGIGSNPNPGWQGPPPDPPAEVSPPKDPKPGLEKLQPLLLPCSYVPTLLGILLLGTADDNWMYSDQGGVTGGIMGLFHVVYAMAYSMLQNSGSESIMQALMIARAGMGVLGLLFAIIVLAMGGSTAMWFCGLYLLTVAAAAAEAYLLYMYIQATFHPAGPRPEAPPVPQPQAPAGVDFGLNVPMQPTGGPAANPGLGGDFGLGGGAGPPPFNGKPNGAPGNSMPMNSAPMQRFY